MASSGLALIWLNAVLESILEDIDLISIQPIKFSMKQ